MALVHFKLFNILYFTKNINHLVDPSPWPLCFFLLLFIYLFLCISHYFISSIYNFSVNRYIFVPKLIKTFYRHYNAVFYMFFYINIELVMLIGIFFFCTLTLVTILIPNQILFADSSISLYESLAWREEQFWLRVDLCDPSIANRIREIYNSSDRYFIYSYIATDIRFNFPVYPEIAIQMMHEVSLNFNPDLIINIVEAAKLYSPDYGVNCEPSSDYWLSPSKAKIWMCHAPTLPRDCRYQASKILERIVREVLVSGIDKRVYIPIDKSIFVKRPSFFDRFKKA